MNSGGKKKTHNLKNNHSTNMSQTNMMLVEHYLRLHAYFLRELPAGKNKNIVQG